MQKTILSWDEAQRWRDENRKRGLITVFTNGCFDLLHLGHVMLLEQAKALGDKLIVGLNSDDSVRKLKGKGRPVRGQDERAEILAGLKSVDAVVIFSEIDPLKLILHLEPDILVKGGDWKIENIIGASEVKGKGGKVFSIPLLGGRSTSAILETIRNTS